MLERGRTSEGKRKTRVKPARWGDEKGREAEYPQSSILPLNGGKGKKEGRKKPEPELVHGANPHWT